MTAVADTTTPHRPSGAPPDTAGPAVVAPPPRMTATSPPHPPVGGAPGPNLATLAQLRGGGRNPMLSPASRRARRTRSGPR